MKKYLLLSLSFLSSLFLSAQEKAEEADQTIQITISKDLLSGEMTWKILFIVSWTVIIIILVARTFRGKADV